MTNSKGDNLGVDIVAAIAATRLSSVTRSIQSSENAERRVQAIASRAKLVLTGATDTTRTEHLAEYSLRDKYIRVLEEYSRTTNYAYHGQEFTPAGLRLWTRAVTALKASGVDEDTFIRAQFTWFHDKFRKAPSPVQLTTNEAVVRAASVKPDKNVRTANIEAVIPKGDLFKRCEKQMVDVMRAQRLTREEVYRNLVIPGMLVFPEVYLKADPTWRKVHNE